MRTLDGAPPGAPERAALARLFAVSIALSIALGFGPDSDGGLEASDLSGRQPLGQLRVGDSIRMMGTGRRYTIGELGRYTPTPVKVNC